MKLCLYCSKPIVGEKKKYCNFICKNRWASRNRSLERIKNPRKYYCKYCGTRLIGLDPQAKFCNTECNKKFLFDIHNAKFAGTDAVTCVICGFKAMNLKGHIKAAHNLTSSEYRKQFNLTIKDTIAQSVLNGMSIRVSGDKNPAYGHNGRLSPYSKNFKKYSEMTDEQKTNKIDCMYLHLSKKLSDGHSLRSQIGYWTDRGYSEDEAIILVSKHQSTFSLEKCIERYGEEVGRQRWKDRQDKWLANLQAKPPKEIERINRAKINFKGFSLISQKLFWTLYDTIKELYNEIYFAQLNNNEKDIINNNEYCLQFDRHVFFLDFYIKDINKVIEFDGDYWHGIKRGNQKRDNIREQKIISAGIQVYRVQERDFKKEPNKVIKECLEFIYG